MGQKLNFTPTLFYQHSKSPHWIWYDIYGDQSKKNELPELAKKLIDEGVLHEEEYVQHLNITKIDKALSEERAEKQTLEYMASGEELIYQGVISCIDGNIKFKGRPDILKKCDGRSNFGNYFYTPIEIKNSTACDKPEYKKQLMLYSVILGKVQGFQPVDSGFINKNKEEIPCKLTDKISEATSEAIREILDIISGAEPSMRITSECKDTPWYDVLLNEARNREDIALIYKINNESLEQLRQLGVRTLSDMKNCDIDSLPKIKGSSIDTLRRAKIQAGSLINNKIIRLSDPVIPNAKTKIYFDIEGDPLLGVQYLFGFLIVKPNQKPFFKYFISERPESEGGMWSDFLDWLKKENLKDFKIYHYHSYEKTYLNKLKSKYGGSHQLDDFIENLVDLSPIIIKSFIFPIYFYSIKDIAKHLSFKWQHEKAGGGQSILWYENWLETNDRSILQDIINYNEDDVRATEFLHRWMISPGQDLGSVANSV